MTNEELLLTAQHIEQHRHATWRPDPYYLEGLKRDPGDIRINQVYGMLLMRRGQFAEAEKHFRTAIKRLTWRSPNPYDSEPYYNQGLVLFYQNKKEEAYDAFYKAAWTNAQQEMSYYYLVCIACGDGEYEHALELVEHSLVKNSHNVKARGLKAVLLRKLNRTEEAANLRAENLELDAFDYVTLFENVLMEKDANEFQERSRGFYKTYLQTARDYAEYGCLEEAICVLKSCAVQQPMIYYYQAYYQQKLEENSKDIIDTLYEKAEQCIPDYCFPNKLEDIAVLEHTITANPKGAKVYYYLGNLYYDKLQYDRAIALWEESIMLDASYPTAHRNLAIAYYNKRKDAEAVRKELEQAFALDKTDSRVFLELDQLYKKLGVSFAERLKQYEAREALIRERDDAMLEWVTLYNLNSEPQKAYDLIMSHFFRPWEGAEGRIS